MLWSRRGRWDQWERNHRLTKALALAYDWFAEGSVGIAGVIPLRIHVYLSPNVAHLSALMNVCRLSIVFATAGLVTAVMAQSPAVRECSYDPAYLNRPLPRMTGPEPELGELERFVLDAFVRTYGDRILPFNLFTLEGESNVRGGPQGIAMNRAWLNLIGQPLAAAILAHELGHIVQAYGLIPLHEDAKAYGPEGEAEYFAGRLLAASGMTEDVFEGGVCPVISRYPATDTHPAGHLRVMLLRGGFYHDR
jgi:hypothetical protein